MIHNHPDEGIIIDDGIIFIIQVIASERGIEDTGCAYPTLTRSQNAGMSCTEAPPREKLSPVCFLPQVWVYIAREQWRSKVWIGATIVFGRPCFGVIVL